MKVCERTPYIACILLLCHAGVRAQLQSVFMSSPECLHSAGNGTQSLAGSVAKSCKVLAA